MHAGLEAGIHDREILVGQGDVDHQRGLHAAYQRHRLRDVVGVNLCRVDGAADLRRDATAFLLGATGQPDLRKHLRNLCALVCHHLPDAAGADDEYP